jgi:hypothetical protein
MSDVKLVNKNGTLYYPESVVPEFGEPGPILLRIYDAGDCDTIRWPLRNKDRENLKVALFDDRERGLVKDGDRVLLPTGVEVEF